MANLTDSRNFLYMRRKFGLLFKSICFLLSMKVKEVLWHLLVSSSHFLSYLFHFTTWDSYLTFVSLPHLRALLCPGILLALLLMPFIFHFIMFLPLYYIIARISIMGVSCPFDTFVLVTFCNPIAPQTFRSPISRPLLDRDRNPLDNSSLYLLVSVSQGKARRLPSTSPLSICLIFPFCNPSGYTLRYILSDKW